MAKAFPTIVTLEEAVQDPYSRAVSYPRGSGESVQSRIRQLRELGVSQLEFSGPLKIGPISILGKGVAGTVVLGSLSNRRVALKIRREDSRRNALAHEAEMLASANAVMVGPRLVGFRNDVLAMEFVDGRTLALWVSDLKGYGRRFRARTVVEALLGQCFRLDKAGLDHGELSRAHKNVIVPGKGLPCILDFESASLLRRASNLTSLCQYLFLGGGFARRLAKILGVVDQGRLLDCLREYKSRPSQRAFDDILAFLELMAKS